MVLELNYKDTKSLIDRLGYKRFLNIFQEIFPEYEVKGLSTDWLMDCNKPLIVNGINYDIAILWKSVKENSKSTKFKVVKKGSK